MPIYIALLRGINVGGKNKLPMVELARLFAENGGSEVKTFIQSGNVLFKAPAAKAKALPKLVDADILKHHSIKTSMVLRTSSELEDVLSHNPFLKDPEDKTDPATLHVMFLADAPTKDQIAKLDPHRSPPDSFVVRGREVYLCLPGGVAETKLSNAYFDSKLATVSTGRNWRTITKLAEMAGAME